MKHCTVQQPRVPECQVEILTCPSQTAAPIDQSSSPTTKSIIKIGVFGGKKKKKKKMDTDPSFDGITILVSSVDDQAQVIECSVEDSD